MNRIKILFVIFFILSLSLSGGCIKRNLRLITDPPGATVYFNEVAAGVTPLDYDFMHYAVHKIEVRKDGYEPITELVRIRTPIFFWIPIDLMLELTPYNFWDRRELSYTLTPRSEKVE